MRPSTVSGAERRRTDVDYVILERAVRAELLELLEIRLLASGIRPSTSSCWIARMVPLVRGRGAAGARPHERR